MLPSSIRFIQRGWFNCNTIVLLGAGGPVVIDTGHRDDARQLLHLLCAEGIEPAGVRLIVNTHCHWDHHGGNRLLQAASGAPIAASAATADLFAQRDRWQTWLDYFGTDSDTPHVDICWQDGQQVTLAGMPFQVVAVPGHAPDMIALFQPDLRLLISADALHDGDCGVINTVVHGDAALDDAIASTEALCRLNPAIALPGHGGILADPQASLQALLRRLHRFKADPAQLAWHLVRRILMAWLLELEPIGREPFIAAVSHKPWLHDYAPRCGFRQPTHLAQQLLDEYLARGLVREAEGLLVSAVPR